MYYLEKTIEVAGSHFLNLNYESKCKNMHGHNWKITVHCKSSELNDNDMVIDFSDIKKIVNELDHRCLNEVLSFNPTAENIACYLCNRIPNCYKVKVVESENNIAVYEKDEEI